MIPTDTHHDPISPPAGDRPVVIYDGECGLCKWLLSGLLAWDRARRLRPLPLGTPEADALLGGLTPEQRAASWHLVAADGTRRSAGAALPAVLDELPGGGGPARVLGALPGPTEAGYRWVAEHRSALSRWVPRAIKRRASERVARAQADANLPSSRANVTS